MKMLYQMTDAELDSFSDATGKMGPIFRPRAEKRWWNVRYLEPYILILLRSLHGQRVTAFYATEKAKGPLQEGA